MYTMLEDYAELMSAASASASAATASGSSTARPRFAGVFSGAGMSWIGAPLELRSTMSLASLTCAQISIQGLRSAATGGYFANSTCYMQGVRSQSKRCSLCSWEDVCTTCKV